jgi:hypothetical protein
MAEMLITFLQWAATGADDLGTLAGVLAHRFTRQDAFRATVCSMAAFSLIFPWLVIFAVTCLPERGDRKVMALLTAAKRKPLPD